MITCSVKEYDDFKDGNLLWYSYDNEFVSAEYVTACFSENAKEECFTYDEYSKYVKDYEEYTFNEVITTPNGREFVVFGVFKN